MRPIRIEMTNFGPYRQEILDFSRLDESNLFLISGRTGAGKSSIFDAMTYALYDKTSSDRPVNELRSTFASLKDPRTRVVFYFEHHNQLYRLERELDLKPRKGLDRGKGIGTSKASLSVVDKVDGIELDKLAGKPKETNQAVVDLLGLTSEQFKQIILLPQYQFSQFLKSPTSEKIPILRQIFGTQVFAKFEDDLAQKWSQARQEQSQLQAKLDGHFTSQIWTEEEREAFTEATSDQRLALAQERHQYYQDALAKAKQEKTEAEKATRQADQAYQTAQKLDGQFQERQAQEARYQTEILEQAEAYQQKQEKLAQLDFANSLADLVKEELAKQAAVGDLEKRIADLQDDLAERQEKQAPLEKRLSHLQAQESQQEKAQEDIENLTLSLNSAQTLAKVQADLKTTKASLEKLARDQAGLSEREQEVKQARTQIEADLVSDRELLDLKKLLQKVQDLVDSDLTKGLQKLVDLQADRQELSDQREASLEHLAGLEADLADLQARLKEIKRDQLKLMVAKLQAELEEGSPCPVCGSLDHPGSKAELVDESALVNLSQEVEELETKLASQQEAFQTQQVEVSQIASQLADKEKASQEQRELLETDYQSLQDVTATYLSGFIWEKSYSHQIGQGVKEKLAHVYQERFDQRSQQDQKLEELSHDLAKLEQDQQNGQEKMASLSGQFKTLEQSQGQILEANPILEEPAYYEREIAQCKASYQAFRQEFESCQKQVAAGKEVLSSLQGRLASQTESLQANQSDLEILSGKLKASLAAPEALTHERSELDDWLADLATGQAVALQTWLTKYQQNKEFLDSSLAELNQVLLGQEEPDLMALTQQKEEADLALTQASNQEALAQRQLHQVSQLVAKIEELLTEAGHHLEEFSQLTQLKNIISGTETGRQRLKLETYVIQAYLEEILTYANDHYIGLLSNQQFEFLIGKEGAGNSQSGLEINIYDRANNKELPASSLSGGETFIASLAIALSLSEVVQNTSNGALVETLLIDEGFGSLDEETLDKAITVLEQIGQNRLVGVISHVKEMKETIQQQVLIEKRSDGSSRIEMKVDEIEVESDAS
ncbi:SbcC/MukB-like Walker B domain-containing protein [Streptococcus downei]|uniref:Nuclease SbcCD subunit C n=1 Tax=Streptococcus downei MFe28 TaxID=764290 RepID=A0A380JEG8_STRDO|nr:SMC family ATPase [Streptococcus downei]SUN36064.1 ATP-dependent dsDNA exonuclease [Streptococcus downei MFe28]